MGSIEENKSPMWPTQEYIWEAKYIDGNVLYEFDNNKKESSFYDIKQSLVESFSLIGNGIKIGFDKNGKFNIAGKEASFIISEKNGNTSIDMKDQLDIITYKDAHADGVYQGMKLTRVERAIDCYNIGYKTKIGDISLQEILSIPVTGNDRRPSFELKLSSKKDIELNIEFNIAKKILQSMDINISKEKNQVMKFYLN